MAGVFGPDINQRADFYPKLLEVREECERSIQRLPFEDTLQSVLLQLRAIEVWTANGRTPTKTERQSLDMSIRMFREYEMTDDMGILHLRKGVSVIHSYVKYWPDDATAADPDNLNYV